jgi:phasin
VSDANVKVEGNTNASNTNGNANLGFDIPLLAIPSLFRGFAEQSADRAKERYEKLKVASEEIAEVLRTAYSVNAKGTADYGAKVIEISSENANSALEYMIDLMGTRSLSEAFGLSAAQSRKSLEAASTQNKELLVLAQKVATESAEPIRKSLAKVLQSAL